MISEKHAFRLEKLQFGSDSFRAAARDLESRSVSREMAFALLNKFLQQSLAER